MKRGRGKKSDESDLKSSSTSPRQFDPDEEYTTTVNVKVSDLASLEVKRSSFLRIVRGTQTGKIVRLGSQPIVAGRSSKTDLVLEDRAASRRHFEVVYSRSAFVLRDLQSTNGTLVNDVPVLECRLSDGDIITVGETDVAFLEETLVTRRDH